MLIPKIFVLVASTNALFGTAVRFARPVAKTMTKAGALPSPTSTTKVRPAAITATVSSTTDTTTYYISKPYSDAYKALCLSLDRLLNFTTSTNRNETGSITDAQNSLSVYSSRIAEINPARSFDQVARDGISLFTRDYFPIMQAITTNQDFFASTPEYFTNLTLVHQRYTGIMQSIQSNSSSTYSAQYSDILTQLSTFASKAIAAETAAAALADQVLSNSTFTLRPTVYNTFNWYLTVRWDSSSTILPNPHTFKLVDGYLRDLNDDYWYSLSTATRLGSDGTGSWSKYLLVHGPDLPDYAVSEKWSIKNGFIQVTQNGTITDTLTCGYRYGVQARIGNIPRLSPIEAGFGGCYNDLWLAEKV